MKIVEGQALGKALRAAADRVNERLWIASPYIGGWPGNVRRILGTAWQDTAKDVRLLTDVDARCFRLNTLQRFFRRGSVRTLAGLHAKLYIIDDFVLVTSANLTGIAFSRRYETGVLLSGAAATQAIHMFKTWWDLKDSRPIREEQLPQPKGYSSDPDTPGGAPLKALWDLPPDTEDEPLPSDLFGDYDAFLQFYADLGRAYKAVPRIWKNAPLNFELDAFLNYLYRTAPGSPSRAYAKKRPRSLTAAHQRQQIRKYALMFAAAYEHDDINESSTWRSERATEVRRLLDRNRKVGLSRSEIRHLLLQLNSMNTYQVNLAKVLNPRNNAIGQIRTTLRALVDDGVPLQRRMSDGTQRVFGMSKAAIQELVGFYYRGKYPLRNKNTNCGLRFLGYDVRVS